MMRIDWRLDARERVSDDENQENSEIKRRKLCATGPEAIESNESSKQSKNEWT
jgi:hypothetical protein